MLIVTHKMELVPGKGYTVMTLSLTNAIGCVVSLDGPIEFTCSHGRDHLEYAHVAASIGPDADPETMNAAEATIRDMDRSHMLLFPVLFDRFLDTWHDPCLDPPEPDPTWDPTPKRAWP